MKKARIEKVVALLMLFFSATTLYGQTGTGLETTHEESGFVPEGYQLDWSDEFDGSELNTNDWKFEIHDPGWVNNELQRYVGKTFRGNKVVFVEDDHLTIRLQKVDDQIVSGRINARPNEGWRYGYFEARIKLPKGRGTWPAFWMMPSNVDWSTNPWPRCGEIDIMEEVGYSPGNVSSSIHCEAYNHPANTQKTHSLYLPTAEEEYHIYALEWTSEKLSFFVDGQKHMEFLKESDDHAVWPFHYAFYPILNLAWGGSWGGAQGVDESALPTEMLVDYVRVYKKPMPATAKKVVAYVTSWSSVAVDANAMTHINYAFGGIDNNSQVYVDGKNRFQEIVALKQKNPALKVLLSIGGWGRGNFSPIAADEAKRKTFAQSCRNFCDQNGIDGIDIDWEFPGNNSSGETSPAGEKNNYTLLMRDLREALGDDLLLTMASSSSPDYYDYNSLIGYLDFVNVMTYDMASPPHHHSALYRGGTVGNGWCVAHESIQNHLKAGIPPEKLVMGLAFYGNGNGDGSGSANQVSLQEIEDGIAEGKWIDHFDDVAKVPYVTNKNGQFVYGYDNARSLTIKCQYIVDNDLAGGMYWEYANDNQMGTERYTVYDCLVGNAVKKENLFFGGVPLEYVGANKYGNAIDLTQGNTYEASGADEMVADDWYYDPDFFQRQDDGTYLFRAVSGKYDISADFNNQCFHVTPLDEEGQPLTYHTWDGTGCIWVIGANSSYGKPTYIPGNDDGWSESRALPMAQIDATHHQITFEVGKQLNPDKVNFKFFHQNSFGNDSNDEFTPFTNPKITTTSDVFYVNYNTPDCGNVKLRSGKKLTPGDVYVFTIDTSDTEHVVLSTENITTSIDEPMVGNSREDDKWYDLMGRAVGSGTDRKGDLPSKQILISHGKKAITP